MRGFAILQHSSQTKQIIAEQEPSVHNSDPIDNKGKLKTDKQIKSDRQKNRAKVITITQTKTL